MEVFVLIGSFTIVVLLGMARSLTRSGSLRFWPPFTSASLSKQ